MKKLLRIFSIFVVFTLFFLTTSDGIFAQSVSCRCAYDNQADQCIPSYGTVTWDTCGPGWSCQCGTPYNYRENCEGDYGCVGVADCDAGICVAEPPPADSQCRVGETRSWKENPNECVSPSYLSGQQDFLLKRYECCTPNPEPVPEPTYRPTSAPIPVYDPTCGLDRDGDGKLDDVKTALGCLPTDPETFVDKALPWAIGIGAGIAFLLGIFGSTMIVLSAGNPEKMQAGKEMITSAIAGVVILVFAVFLLDFIGVKVLKLFSF